MLFFLTAIIPNTSMLSQDLGLVPQVCDAGALAVIVAGYQGDDIGAPPFVPGESRASCFFVLVHHPTMG